MIIEASLLLVAGIDLPPSVLGIAFAALNLVAFALFGIDKRRAARKEWRIPERTLLLSSLVGGFIGAWAAVRVSRHKTRKLSFLTPLVILTAASIVLWLWLFGVLPLGESGP